MLVTVEFSQIIVGKIKESVTKFFITTVLYCFIVAKTKNVTKIQ